MRGIRGVGIRIRGTLASVTGGPVEELRLQLVGPGAAVPDVEDAGAPSRRLDAVPRRRRKGVAIVEAAQTYGIYLVLIAGALALAIGVWNRLSAQQLVEGIQSIRGAVFSYYASESNFAGVSADLVGKSGLVEENLVIPGATVTDPVELEVSGYLITIADGGTAMGVDHNTGMGIATNTTAGARYFFIQVHELDDEDDCVKLLTGTYGNLRMQGIYLDTLDLGTVTAVPAATLLPDGTVTADVTATQGSVWTEDPTATMTDLEDITRAQVQDACEEAINRVDEVDLLFAFRN